MKRKCTWEEGDAATTVEALWRKLKGALPSREDFDGLPAVHKQGPVQWQPDEGVPCNPYELVGHRGAELDYDDADESSGDVVGTLTRLVLEADGAEKCRVAVIGPSGCGKSAALRCMVTQPATETLVPVWMDFAGHQWDGLQSGISDPGVEILVEEVRALALHDATKMPDGNVLNTLSAAWLVEQYLTAKLLLRNFVGRTDYIAGTGKAFYLVQATGWGQQMGRTLYKALQTMPRALVRAIRELCMSDKRHKVVLVVDEGRNALDMCPTWFRHPANLDVSCGLLGPIFAGLPDDVVVIVAGTTMRLLDVMCSDVRVTRGSSVAAAGPRVHVVSHFVEMTPKGTCAMLRRVVKVDDASRERLAALLCGKGVYVDFFRRAVKETAPHTVLALEEAARDTRRDMEAWGLTRLKTLMDRGMLTPGDLTRLLPPMRAMECPWVLWGDVARVDVVNAFLCRLRVNAVTGDIEVQLFDGLCRDVLEAFLKKHA